MGRAAYGRTDVTGADLTDNADDNGHDDAYQRSTTSEKVCIKYQDPALSSLAVCTAPTMKMITK